MPRGRKGRRTRSMINIAKERIDILFELAENEAMDHNLHRSNRYAELARKIGMRYNVRIPRWYKRKLCKHCHSYLVPSVNSRVRLRSRNIVISCDNCGAYTRIPLIREKGKIKAGKAKS
ncbi:MAG: ribonuclease P [Thermoplasmata archaeon]|nr:MAG: ribonuclease P [Thermoplasmata archaeon]